MADERPQKVSIGFHGGQVLSARVAAPELKRLRGALGSTGWHDLTAEDGTVALDLSRVAPRRYGLASRSPSVPSRCGRETLKPQEFLRGP